MHAAKFLAITNNTTNYAGVADWSKPTVMSLCIQAVWPGFLLACTLAYTSCERVELFNATTMADDTLTQLTY